MRQSTPRRRLARTHPHGHKHSPTWTQGDDSETGASASPEGGLGIALSVAQGLGEEGGREGGREGKREGGKKDGDASERRREIKITALAWLGCHLSNST